MPPTLTYEHEQNVAEGEFVMVHGRFSGFRQAKNWIAADIVRVVDGVLVEYWDVIEDEASKAESISGRPMFGDRSRTSGLQVDGARLWRAPGACTSDPTDSRLSWLRRCAVLTRATSETCQDSDATMFARHTLNGNERPKASRTRDGCVCGLSDTVPSRHHAVFR
jgi:hypothetical protein